MKIKKVTIRGFKSIIDEVTIDFDKLKGLTKIVGAVGSGKTTIGEAILYGLYGTIKGKNLADLINLKSKELLVEIELESKGHLLKVIRGMKLSKGGKMTNTAFEATCDGDPIVFSNKKEAQSILENEYYDTNRMSVELLCIISFNNFKSLLTMNTKERTDFLNQMFGLELLQEYGSLFKDEIKTKNGKLTSLNNENDKANAGINALTEVVCDYVVDIDASREDYKKLQIKKESLEAARTTESAPLNERLRDLEDKYAVNNKESIECVAEGKLVAQQLKLFDSGCCPTCGQKAPSDLIIDLSGKKKTLSDRYLTIQSILKGINNDKDTCNSELREIYDRYTKQIETIKNEQSSITSNVNSYKRQLEQIKAKDNKISEYNKSIEENNGKIKDLNIEVDKCQRIYDILTSDIKRSIIGSFIPTINKSINNYAIRFGLPFMIEFNEAFEPSIVNTKFSTEVPLSTLSTGQGKAVDTCIILGVIDALISKINFNVTFFDELMSNMDAEMRDNICKVLKETASKDQSIFIINHAELNDEYFNNSILVVNNIGSKYIFNK